MSLLPASDGWSIDRRLMHSLLVLSSSDAARLAAALWLAAFDAARRSGLAEAEAHVRAGEAWRAAVGGDSGPAARDSGMLAATLGTCSDARPPPASVAI
jgi:hypothetical protein